MASLPNDLLWESVEAGLIARLTHSFGTSWWVNIDFDIETIPEAALVNLMHMNAWAQIKTIFTIAMPFVVPRWASDTTVVTSLTMNLYEALANTIKLYILNKPLPVGNIGVGDITGLTDFDGPDALIELPTVQARTWKLDRLRSTIADKHSAAIMDGEGE